ncbi:hypothetical protein [Bacillus mycoides]|uniref:hypothetical protein n=1 Tax=Bacillus mycoides TaxID=1405 RepID=UPI001C92F500|nr:hypothetical protein [Bacillus mycoides]
MSRIRDYFWKRWNGSMFNDFYKGSSIGVEEGLGLWCYGKKVEKGFGDGPWGGNW